MRIIPRFAKKETIITTTDKGFLYPISDSLSVFGSTSAAQNLKYFETVPELNNVILTAVRMLNSMDIFVANKVTGERVPITDPLQHLLSNPNWWQSTNELFAQDFLFYFIHGNSYMNFTAPFGFGKDSIKQMSSLNPLFLKRALNIKKVPNFTLLEAPKNYGWTYTENESTILIPYEDVMHLNFNNVKDGNDIGSSPIQAIRPNLDNIISAYEARGKNLRSHGAIGILSNAGKDGIGAAAPMSEKEKINIQNDMRRYGIASGQWSTIITNLNLQWQKMGSNAKDLMLFEEIEDDFQKICDQYGISRELFSTIKGTTYANQKEAEKQTYTNTIIPLAQDKINGLNKYFETDSKPYEIKGSFDHLTIFNENKKERASAILLTTNALSKAYQDGAISLEQYQLELKNFGL